MDKDIKRDINGKPITRKNSVPFQHEKEVDDAVHGLGKEIDSLIKKIKNPKLTSEVKKTIKDVINEFDVKLKEWEKYKKGMSSYV
jgi:signal recognition particle subunit SEC65